MKQTIYIPRYPAKGEFPEEHGEYYVFLTVPAQKAVRVWNKFETENGIKWERQLWEDTVLWWSEEKTLPSDDEIKELEKEFYDKDAGHKRSSTWMEGFCVCLSKLGLK